jgi:Synergist-CTERM protein sorting domain-containing protein
MTAPLLLALALGAVSSSRLGVVVMGDTTGSPILAACPRLVVFPVDSTNTARVASQISAYRAACSGGHVVVQVGGTGTVVSRTIFDLVADSWILQVRSVQGSVPVDAVEGPWEPIPQVNANDLNEFWAQFALRMSAAGFLPIVGALPPGPQPGSPGPANSFCATVDAVRLVGVPFAWSHHARSLSLATVPTDDALDFRQIRSDCALAGVRVYLTQAGAFRAWQATDQPWLSFFNGQLVPDLDVIGAALFQLGGAAAGTAAFDLSVIETAVAAHLRNPQPFDGGFPDGGLPDGGGGSSGGTLAPGHGGAGGDFSPSRSGGGCSSAGGALLLLAIVPLAILRRWKRQGVKRYP